MATGRITKRAVDSLEAGASDVLLWDTELKGFGLKVTPKGSKTYLVQFRMGGREASTRRFTIGKHGSPWTPDTARQRAQQLLISTQQGVDPIEVDRVRRVNAINLAFDRYVDIFVERYAKKEQLRSWKQAESVLKNHATPRFRSTPITELKRRDIAVMLEDIVESTPATARYLHAVLRKLFRWAVSRGDLGSSPISDMSAPAPVSSRDRVLSDAELQCVWSTSSKLGFPFGPAFRLLIATGQRREEVGGMEWSEVDLDHGTWTIPAKRSKNGLPHVVPLSGLARSVFEHIPQIGTFVFSTTGRTAPSGWSKAKARLANLALIDGQHLEDWRTHDIRRTVATGLQRLHVRFEVTEAVLNHVSGARAGVAGIYQRYHWSSEKREALTSWGEAIERLARGDPLLPAPAAEIIRFNARSRVA